MVDILKESHEKALRLHEGSSLPRKFCHKFRRKLPFSKPVSP